jgi:hypothetical protein
VTWAAVGSQQHVKGHAASCSRRTAGQRGLHCRSEATAVVGSSTKMQAQGSRSGAAGQWIAAGCMAAHLGRAGLLVCIQWRGQHQLARKQAAGCVAPQRRAKVITHHVVACSAVPVCLILLARLRHCRMWVSWQEHRLVTLHWYPWVSLLQPVCACLSQAPQPFAVPACCKAAVHVRPLISLQYALEHLCHRRVIVLPPPLLPVRALNPTGQYPSCGPLLPAAVQTFASPTAALLLPADCMLLLPCLRPSALTCR